MIAELIAWAVVAMAIMIVVPLSIALGIWIRDRARRRRVEDWQMFLKELRKTADRHEADIEAAKERQRLFEEKFDADRERTRKFLDQLPDPPNIKKGDDK